MKIRTRLTIYFSLLIMVVVIIRSLVLYYSIASYSERVFFERIKAKAVTTAQRRLYLQNVDSALLARIDKVQSDLLLNENISVYDSADREIYTNNDTINYNLSKELFDRIRDQDEIHYQEGRHKIVGFEYNLAGNRNIVIAGAEDQYGEALLQEMRYQLLLLALLSMGVVVVLGWNFAGRALAPIALIVKKVSTLSPIEKSERLDPPSEKDEIAALVTTFNDLFDKLEESFKLQKFFVANVSHEMNNPLAKIKSQIEVSLIQNRDKEAYREILESVLEDVNELIILMQDLMKFSKVSKDTLTYEDFRIDELLFEIRDSVLENNPFCQVDIILTDPPQSDKTFVVTANRPLITTAIKNVVDNACKYSTDHAVHLSLHLNKGKLELSIMDKGPGIDPEDLPYIFNIFYRSQHQSTIKGFGIGLALAQKIIKAHGFDIAISSELGKGTVFSILF
jgi:signal transduction histidine kinase